MKNRRPPLRAQILHLYTCAICGLACHPHEVSNPVLLDDKPVKICDACMDDLARRGKSQRLDE